MEKEIKKPKKIKKNIICRRITLVPIGTSEEKKISSSYMKKIIGELTGAANEIIRYYVFNQFEIDKYRAMGEETTYGERLNMFLKDKGLDDINSPVYFKITRDFPHINSRVVALLIQSIRLKIEKSFYDVLKNKISIPSFKTTTLPIPFEPVIKKDGDYFHICFPMSLEGRKIYSTPKFGFRLGRDRSNNKIIIERILNGEYKCAGSSFQLTSDNEFILNMSVHLPIVKSETINPKKIMGIDLGINRPVSIYIDGEKHQPNQIQIGEKIQSERMRFFKQRRAIQQSLKFSKGGHGRNRKLSGLERIREKESDWSKLINHQISKSVIDVCQQYNVGIIKMEDLTGITTNKNDYFLKSWAYYQLQSFITYKAKLLGIKVEWVNPKNTSITCPTCGNVDSQNRSDEDKTKFKCTNFLCEDFEKVKDADIVGAYNITYREGQNIKDNSKEGKLLKGLKKKQDNCITTSDGVGCTTHSDSLNKQEEIFSE